MQEMQEMQVLKSFFLVQNGTLYVEINGLLDYLFAEHKTAVYQFKKLIEQAQARELQAGISPPLSIENAHFAGKKQAKAVFLSVGEGFGIIKDFVPQQTRAKLKTYEELVFAQFFSSIVADFCAENPILEINPNDFLFDLSLWEVKKSYEEMKQLLVDNSNQINQLNFQINERDLQIQQLQERVGTLQLQLVESANLSELQNELQAECTQLKCALVVAIQDKTDLESRLQDLTLHIEKQQIVDNAQAAELVQKQQIIQDANIALRLAIDENAASQANCNAIASQLQSALSQIVEAENVKNDSIQQLAICNQAFADLQSENSTLQQENALLLSNSANLAMQIDELAQLKKQLAAAQKNSAELQAQLSAKSSMRGWLTSADASLWVTITVCIIFLPFSYLSITKYIQIGDTSSWAFSLIAFGMAAIWDFSILYFAINGKTGLAKFGMVVQTVFLAAKFDYIVHLCTSVGISAQSANQTQLIIVVSAIVFYTPKLVHSLTTLASADKSKTNK